MNCSHADIQGAGCILHTKRQLEFVSISAEPQDGVKNGFGEGKGLAHSRNNGNSCNGNNGNDNSNNNNKKKKNKNNGRHGVPGLDDVDAHRREDLAAQGFAHGPLARFGD